MKNSNENIKKVWFKISEVSELTGLSLPQLRLLADKNPYKVRWLNGRRKFHFTFVETLTKIKL